MNRRISNIDLNITYCLPFLRESLESLPSGALEKQEEQVLKGRDMLHR